MSTRDSSCVAWDSISIFLDIWFDIIKIIYYYYRASRCFNTQNINKNQQYCVNMKIKYQHYIEIDTIFYTTSSFNHFFSSLLSFHKASCSTEIIRSMIITIIIPCYFWDWDNLNNKNVSSIHDEIISLYWKLINVLVILQFAYNFYGYIDVLMCITYLSNECLFFFFVCIFFYSYSKLVLFHTFCLYFYCIKSFTGNVNQYGKSVKYWKKSYFFVKI